MNDRCEKEKKTYLIVIIIVKGNVLVLEKGTYIFSFFQIKSILS